MIWNLKIFSLKNTCHKNNSAGCGFDDHCYTASNEGVLNKILI
jgi:hypothetical protein